MDDSTAAAPAATADKRNPTALEPSRVRDGARPTIFRIRHTERFTILDNVTMEQLRQKPALLGFWAYLMKHPDDFVFDRGALCRAMELTRGMLGKLIRELEDEHLARRRKVRSMGRKFAGVELDIFETPQLAQVAHLQPELFGDHGEWEPLRTVGQKSSNGQSLFAAPNIEPPVQCLKHASSMPEASISRISAKCAVDRFSGDGKTSARFRRHRQNQRPVSPVTANEAPIQRTAVDQGPSVPRRAQDNKDLTAAAAQQPGVGCAASGGPCGPHVVDQQQVDFIVQIFRDRRIGFTEPDAGKIARHEVTRHGLRLLLEIVALCLVTEGVQSRPAWLRSAFRRGGSNNFAPLKGRDSEAKLVARFRGWLADPAMPTLALAEVPSGARTDIEKARQLRALAKAERDYMPPAKPGEFSSTLNPRIIRASEGGTAAQETPR